MTVAGSGGNAGLRPSRLTLSELHMDRMVSS
jgi:hypothetical protein